MAGDQEADGAAEAEVTELSASADGSIHASLELPLGDPEAQAEDEPEPGIDDPGPDVVGGVAKVPAKFSAASGTPSSPARIDQP